MLTMFKRERKKTFCRHSDGLSKTDFSHREKGIFEKTFHRFEAKFLMNLTM